MNKKNRSRGREHIILFTRLPKPGAVKTRLINRLGPQGAAELHDKMTIHVLRRIQPILKVRKIQLQVYYCGGSRKEMVNWLGNAYALYSQQGSNLGQRMEHALTRIIRQGADRALLIGSDCPALDADILSRALDSLDSHDLVLGPAADGGYYLIGLRAGKNGYANLFANIDWGTDQVLQQTLTQAKKSRFSYTLLPRLHDIDRPEDLVYFNHHTCS